ncbi:MAG: hypothetical protein KJO36_09070, partial [Acidimicrobiia bacterium]|nr:hypothetical protein [Acidimicrobiia bacterium]
MLAVVNNGTHFLADLVGALDRLRLEHEVLAGDRRLPATAITRYSGAILTGGHLHVYDPDHHPKVALDEQFL